MPLDQYVTLGRSGLRVSPLCLGAMTFGEDLGWGTSVEESQQIIDRYIEAGGNFIDTANFYTRSHSEEILGDHIGLHDDVRAKLDAAGARAVSLGPVSVHADDAIAIAMNELDRRAILGTEPGK